MATLPTFALLPTLLDPKGKLDLAEALMTSVMETFDTTHASECEHCGSRKRNNWTDYQANEHASLIVNRISKIRGLLGLGEAKGQDDAIDG